MLEISIPGRKINRLGWAELIQGYTQSSKVSKTEVCANGAF